MYRCMFCKKYSHPGLSPLTHLWNHCNTICCWYITKQTHDDRKSSSLKSYNQLSKTDCNQIIPVSLFILILVTGLASWLAYFCWLSWYDVAVVISWLCSWGTWTPCDIHWFLCSAETERNTTNGKQWKSKNTSGEISELKHTRIMRRHFPAILRSSPSLELFLHSDQGEGIKSFNWGI